MFRLCLFFTAVWLAAGDTLYFQPQSVNDIICDDKKTSCPDGSTCCSLPSGGYGCCPMPKAVCCSDHQHCCPTGHKCDVSAGTCLTASGARRPWVLKRPAKSLSTKAQAVICPGGQYQCPNGQTCCPQDGGGFACCPFNKATCCSDHSHCCPHDYKCDLSHGTCVKSGAAKVLLGKVQEAASVVAGANTAKKPQHKLNLQTSTGTKPKTKEATPKQIPDPSKIKVTQKVAKPAKVPPKVSQKSMAKPIPKKTVNTPKVVKQKANVATQANVKLKAKVVQASNIKAQAVPAVKQGTLPKDKIQTGASAPKTKSTSRSIKKEKRVLEAITDKIQATVEAIKETVHRVVGRSGETGEKVSGKKPAKSAKSNGEKKKGSKKAPPLVTPTFEGAKPAKTGKLPTPATAHSSKRKEKVTPQKTVKTAQVKSKIVTDKKAVASDSNKMHQAKLREVRQKLQKTAETIHHKVGVKGQIAKGVQSPTLGKAHLAQQSIKKKILQEKYKQQQNLQQQKLQHQRLQQQKMQEQKLKQQKLLQQQQQIKQQKLKQQKLEQQKLLQQKIEQQKLQQQKLEQQKIEQQKLQQKVEQQKQQQKKLQQQKLQQQKLQQQKLEQQKVEQQKLLQQKLQQQKIEQQKLQQQKLQQQKLEQHRLQQQKLQQQKLQEQILKQQRLQQQKLEEQKLQQQKLEQQKLQQQKIQQQKLEQQKLNEQKIQQQKLQQQKLEQQKLQQQKLQQQKLEQQKLQQQKIQQQKLEQQKLQHKLQQQKLQQQKLQQQKLQQQKLQQQKLQQQTLQQQKLQPNLYRQNLQTQKQQNQVQKQQHKMSKASVKDIPKKQTQRGSSGNIGTGRRLLGLAWRFLGLDNTESDELSESAGEQPAGEKNRGWDFDAGMEDEQFVVEGDEFEIVEEDGLELVPGVSSHVKVTCPDKSTCPDGTTCCQMATGSYGCCPMPNAVCCSDHIHCCPDGETCDVEAGSCNTANGATSKLHRKFPATVAEESSVTCPGGSTECPSGSTCCHIRGDTYGCCPLPSAVCCNDGIHCCPHGYTCGQGKCVKGNLAIPWMVKTPSQPKAAVTCPGGGTECPSGSTCCLIAGGVYACCPLPNAVCCKDKIHCCPQGYTCGQGKCVKGNLAIPWVVKTPSQPKAAVTCPGGGTECPSGSTCCLIAGGVYACCPLPNAVCCKDQIHCCPQGYTCGQGKCVKGNLAIPWVVKTPSQPKAAVTCPGGGTECPSGSTCCLVAGGVYACCPLPNAVCCKDKIHCCPQGYTCGQGKCVKGNLAIPWVVKTPSQPKAAVTCPGGGTECPSGSTCCLIAGGVYACCPLPNAVCCKDKIHCCPQGYTCGQGKCVKGNLAIPWVMKTPSQPKAAVTCPGGGTECPSGSTCCLIAGGVYACCPLPNAVCCKDKIHCCPQGYTCGQGKCVKGNLAIPWVVKTPSQPKAAVTCPGGGTECPSGSTCCLIAGGVYACCPLPNAVCCKDKIHCCPQGYTCGQGKCVKGNLAIPWVVKTPSQPKAAVTCPGGGTECPSGSTCCLITVGVYACCPLPNAVCCKDKIHCCPQGYTCGQGKCVKGNLAIPWVVKTPSQPKAAVTCPGGGTECPSGSTCCLVAGGVYACCPLPNAVCCKDKIHCCPQGYTCGQGKCVKGDMSIPLMVKTPSQPKAAVTCPGGGTECPSGSTCCYIAGGIYSCCALPNAVCCKNELHCCPQGYTCGQSKCVKGNLAIPWMVKTPSKPKGAVANKMVCPGKKTTCPGDSTCCQVATGGYGCCPLPNAVCCSDKEHCCPAGYVCDPKTAMCILSTDSVPFSMKQPARQLSNVASPVSVQDIICPDQRSMCPDEATCCKMESGAWGCCPMPNAICCSDHKHCCPQGTKCDVSAGMCVSSTSSLSVSHTLLTPRSKVNLAMAANEASPKQSLTIVKCADETECPDGDTCCIMSSGKYACCPHNDATCCPDKQHCCPKGYTCGEKGAECKKGSMSVSAVFIARLQAKRPSQPQVLMQVMDIKCADSETSCPQGNTCCAMQAGGYGCCALPNAVCCKSGSCCPKGHTCDASGTRCIVSIPWMKKTASSPTLAGEEKTLPQACPNTRFTCAAGNTCCQMEGDNWGCCASPDAVCCKNGPYCCPKGRMCSDQPGQCVPAGGSESAKHAATFVQRAARGGHILY